MSKLLIRLNHFLAELCGWLLCVVMVFIFSDFVSRGLGHPLFGVAELAMFAMVAAVYLGLAHCEEVRAHVRVEAVLTRLPPIVQDYLNVIGYLVATVIIGIVTYAVFLNTLSSFDSKEAIAGVIPLVTYPVKIVMCVALCVYFAQLCLHTLGYVRVLFAKDDASG